MAGRADSVVMSDAMMFKAEFTARDLWLSPEDELAFDFGGRQNLRVLVRRPSKDGNRSGGVGAWAFAGASTGIA